MKPTPPAVAASGAARTPRARLSRIRNARSLLGAGLPARLAIVAAALALLWLTLLWALA